MDMKHLSYIANDVISRCSQKLETPVDALVEEFESSWNPEIGDYSRKLLEFCSTKALNNICSNIEEQINDGFFSRFSFDVMLAWEKPKSADEEQDSVSECVAKEKEEKHMPTKLNKEQDEVPLFYSDIMPLLVDHGPSVGERAFVWFAALVPLIADVVNGKFSFETLTATTGKRLYFPAYDKFLKEIDKCIKHLQKQAKPVGVELVDDEFILHVEGIATSPRVVRHIGGTSWPGRLTLTNYALYFEASGVISYEDAIKLDLSKAIGSSVKAAATGPWGAPLFDKAIIYESSELQESVVLEFPEMTSTTRRDHWLALIQEIMLLHRFLSKYNVDSPVQVWEMHARAILGIIRLHAAREMLRISPPTPHSFLIFFLFEEFPKGDFVLDALSESVKNSNSGHPCSASSILRSLNVSQACALCVETEEITEKGKTLSAQSDNISSLESAIDQVREEAKEVVIAKATTKGLKKEGISDSAAVLIELLKPLKNVLFTWLQKVLTWEKPGITVMVTGISLLIVYEEWIGKAIAALLLWMVAKMIQARRNRVGSKYNKVVVCTASDKSTVENIVSAQHGLRSAHEMLQLTNISILKIWSILVSKAPKHTNTVMVAVSLSAILLAVVPFKFIIMGLVLYVFAATSGLGKRVEIEQGSSKRNRRLKEWWDSIPVIPVEVLDKMPENTS